MTRTTAASFLLALALGVAPQGQIHATTAPALLNYQGVLRDASNQPLSGTYNMVFRFFNAASGGSLILIDRHTDSRAVMVGDGLFNVELGGGTVEDGTGPGTYTSLADVFRDHAAVWLEVRVGTENLLPRIRVLSAAYALNSTTLQGKSAGEFVDTSSTQQVKLGRLVLGTSSPNPGSYGIQGTGADGGGYFRDSNSSSAAFVAAGDDGIAAWGTHAGGFLQDSDGSGWAYVGFGDRGIEARGNEMAGFFQDTDSSGQARVAWGDNGLSAYGNATGGYFQDLDSSGFAYVGFGDRGIAAHGNEMGGFFGDLDSSGTAQVASGDHGIMASGEIAGGFFEDLNSSGAASVAFGDLGISASGNDGGGYFSDPDAAGVYAYVGVDGGPVINYKIMGSGTVSFVQNHPERPDRVIVYAAPEGDEVAVYTRGTARLADGEARVALGDTFQWVTNPDIGLTAHLTPRGSAVPLAVESLDTRELVVRGPADAEDVVFDYLVFGLRIGFERAPHVQEKRDFSPVPDPERARAYYGGHPEMERFTALARFRNMNAAKDGASDQDLTRSARMIAAINRFDPEIDGRLEKQAGTVTTSAPRAAPTRVADREDEGTLPFPPQLTDSTGNASGKGECPLSLVEVSEPVEAGDVLVVDLAGPDRMRASTSPGDRAVVGVVAEEPETADGESALRAPVAFAGIVSCKVDAGYGSIRAGDLLVTSPTPGHAMRADDPEPGTVLGKALEPLDSGSGAIRVLVTLR